jgi:hypothetical protein
MRVMRLGAIRSSWESGGKVNQKYASSRNRMPAGTASTHPITLNQWRNSGSAKAARMRSRDSVKSKSVIFPK